MEEQRKRLLERLKEHKEAGEIPFHMPGHKRNSQLAPYLAELGAGLDITEISGFDDLHAPSGILQEAMEAAACLWGSEHAFFLVNGSTGGILAGIRAATRYGDRVLVARNCHKAVYHAIELCGLVPVYIQPPLIEGFGCASSLPPEEVERALALYPDIKLVILTSPSYEGVVSDVASICQAAHGRGIPVLVDEAHGAHLGFGEGFPPGAVSQGADLVIHSLHKTLPSLTQSGLLHVKSPFISREAVARQLGIFQTSSPSYLLMASMDGCVDLLKREAATLFSAWRQRLAAFEEEIRSLKKLSVLGYGEGGEHLGEAVYALDPSKLVIRTVGLGLSGTQLMERLREEHHIELEMAMEGYCLAMTGMGDRPESLSQLSKALVAIDTFYKGELGDGEKLTLPPIPEQRLTPAKACDCPFELLAPEGAEGRICGEGIWAYPPGIPLVLPGEVLTGALISYLLRLANSGVRVLSTRGVLPASLAVLAEGEG